MTIYADRISKLDTKGNNSWESPRTLWALLFRYILDAFTEDDDDDDVQIECTFFTQRVPKGKRNTADLLH